MTIIARYMSADNTVIYVESGYPGAPLITQDGDENWTAITTSGDPIDPFAPTLAEAKAAKILESRQERDYTKSLGAESVGLRFDITSQDKKDSYARLRNLVSASQAPIASFLITGGTSGVGVNKVDSVIVSGVDILGAAVDWQGSNEELALRVSSQINDHTSSPDYQASYDGARVFVWPKAVSPLTSSPVTIAAGTTVTVNVSGDVTVSSDRAFTGGTAPMGNWPVLDPFSLDPIGFGYVPSIPSLDPGQTLRVKNPLEGDLFLHGIADWENSVEKEHEFLVAQINAAATIPAVEAIDVVAPYLPYRP